jgi:hypothetical protein
MNPNFTPESNAYRDGYTDALKRLNNLRSGEYWADWVHSETYRRIDKIPEKPAPLWTGSISTGIEIGYVGGFTTIPSGLNFTSYGARSFGGCIDTKVCNSCKTIFTSSICVCALWDCTKCGSPIELTRTGNKEDYIVVRY